MVSMGFVCEKGAWQQWSFAMPALIDLTGKKFTRLLVLGQHSRDRRGKIKWLCRCDCGAESVVLGVTITSGQTKSCGCLRRAKNIVQNLTHGLSRHPLAKVWYGMRARCTYTANKAYRNYGGRGIAISPLWGAFQPFYDWAMVNGYASGLTLDRIDNDGPYAPDNCKWIPKSEQPKNRRPFSQWKKRTA